MSDIKNPLIVTDKGSPKLPFVINLQSYLSNSNVKSDLFFDISPNPREDEVSVGCKKYKNGNHDAIIAIGGGSAMDGGKLICLTANNDVPLRDFEFELTPPKISKDNPFPKIITIPTTAGTGAETEITAMVTYIKEGMKFCMWHPDVRPSLALIDPELTIGQKENHPPTCLKSVLEDNTPSALTMLTYLANSLQYWEKKYKVHGFQYVKDAWLALTYSLGSKVEIHIRGKKRKGYFQGINDSGSFILKENNSISELSIGDVFFV